MLGIYFDTLMRRDPALLADVPKRWGRLLRLAKKNPGKLTDYAAVLLDAAVSKFQMRGKLEAAWRSRSRSALRHIALRLIPRLVEKTERFAAAMRQNYLATAKPQGMEHLQCRNAAVVGRLEETARRILEYLNGRVDTIAELDEIPPPDAPVEELHRHRFIASANWSI